MAVYVFKCREHGKFEVAMSMSEYNEDQVCPECGEPAIRVFLATRVNWKQPLGSGNGQSMEVYTNSKDAEDQLFESIMEEE